MSEVTRARIELHDAIHELREANRALIDALVKSRA
jgi:hypothetical protein